MGLGSYHGIDGFNAFSHYKSVVDKKTWIDLPMRYQPYKSKLYEKLLQKYIADSSQLWEGYEDCLRITNIGSTIGTHIGPGAVAVAFFAM